MFRVLHKKNHLRKVSCHSVTICGTVFLFPSGRSGGLIDRVLAPVVRKPISTNPRLNRPNLRIKFNLLLVSVPESAISTIPGLK